MGDQNLLLYAGVSGGLALIAIIAAAFKAGKESEREREDD